MPEERRSRGLLVRCLKPTAPDLLLLAFAAATILAVCFLAAPALAQKKPPAKPLDLNSATQKELEELPGIGPVTAKAIVDFRQKGGPFRRVEDLLVVRGVSENRLKQIRPYVFVKPPGKPPAKPPVKPAQPVQPAKQ